MKPWQVVVLVVMAVAIIAVLGVAAYAAVNDDKLPGSEPPAPPVAPPSEPVQPPAGVITPTVIMPEEPPAGRPCAQLGQMCGGIMGIQCCGKMVCLYDGKPNAQYPDQSGVCTAEAPDKPCETLVPDLVGLPIDDALLAVAQAYLVAVQDLRCSTSGRVGVVLSQLPAAGTKQPCGTRVTLTFNSDGVCPPAPCQVTVSNWIGKDRAVAEKQARDLGLNPSSRPRCSRDNVAGSVEIQSLAAGTTVACGTQIVFTYSDANICPPCTSKVPDVLRKPVSEAVKLVQQANLTPTVVEQCGRWYAPDDTVHTISPFAGTTVLCGSEVQINYCPKSAGATVVDVTGKTIGDAEAALKNAGFIAVLRAEECGTQPADGIVHKMSPAPGTFQLKGREILLYFCPKAEPCTTVLSVMIDHPVSEAEEHLRRINLVPVLKPQCGAPHKDGLVTGFDVGLPMPYDPAAIPCGTVITLHYNDYKLCTVKIPETIGMKIDDAVKAIESADLKPITATNCNDDGGKPHNSRVNFMVPWSRQMVAPGWEIYLYYCPLDPGKVEVPSVMSMFWRDGEQKIRDAGLTPVARAHCGGGDAPNDLIHTQSPAPQQIVQRGSNVDIYYCPRTARVPDVMGKTPQEAEEIINWTGLKYKTQSHDCNVDALNGKVYVIEPPIGTELTGGSMVTITWCNRNAQPPKVKIPNIMGMQFSAAEKALKDAGLTPVVHAHCGGGDLPNDLVHTCAPAVGQEVDPGAQVEIYYCPREIKTFAAYEEFEHGWIFWRQDTDEIYVLQEGHLRRVFKNTWQQGVDDEFPCGVPHGIARSCPPMPKRGIGKVWCQLGPGALPSIGWATTCEQGYNMTIQIIGDEMHITDPSGRVFVLRSDGVWWTGF